MIIIIIGIVGGDSDYETVILILFFDIDIHSQ
jgi:hypothetical protein